MIAYHKNNILFRIASADAISKFKSIQAHSFAQVVRTDISFDAAAKEVVLLEYDRFSQWLYKMERILLNVGDAAISRQLQHALVESFREEINVIETVLTAHESTFPATIVDFTKMVHAYSQPMLHAKLSEMLQSDSASKCFGNMVDLITDYLQHMLTSLHEYSNNVVNASCPFLCVSSWCMHFKDDEMPFLSMIRRAQFFKKMNTGSTFTLKNYTSGDFDSANIVSALNKFDIHTRTEALE